MQESKKKKDDGGEVIATTIRVEKALWKRFRIETIERDLGQQEAIEHALNIWLAGQKGSEAGEARNSEAVSLLEGLTEYQRGVVLGLVELMRTPKQEKVVELVSGLVQDYIPARKAAQPMETKLPKRIGVK